MFPLNMFVILFTGRVGFKHVLCLFYLVLANTLSLPAFQSVLLKCVKGFLFLAVVLSLKATYSIHVNKVFKR